MNKRIFLAISSVIAITSLIIGIKAQADNTPGNNSVEAYFLLPPLNEKSEEYGNRLLMAIIEIKKVLQEQVDNQLVDAKYRAKIVKSKDVPIEIVLALWNPTNSETDLVRTIKVGKKITQLNGNNYLFKLVVDNGVNSKIEVTNRPDLKVIGLIHPVFADISSAKQPKYRLDNVVYIPYTELINNQVIIKAGEEYLYKKITAVYDELNSLGIRSLADPSKLITETIDPRIVITILAIEHVDSSVLINNSAENYVAKFYATLAVNEHNSYAYAKSSASARGLVQFIPSTYASIRKLRPQLTLPADFVQGMTDPYNAIKAEIGLLDYNLTLLPKETRITNSSSVLETGAYLAAMYNGGPSRVRKAINKWGDSWDSYHGNISTGLRAETAYYVAKFRLVYKHFENSSLHLAAFKE